MSAFITCEHVDFGYEHHDVVLDLSMELNPGDYLCVVGENGSGKSTLMKGLLGLLKPTGGRLAFSSDLKKNGIGYLPQQTDAQKDFPATVMEITISGALGQRGNRPFYSPAEKQMARDSLQRLGILDLHSVCYRELSGGQQQRVLIARALCATEQLLILDEPTTGLDPAAIQEFYHMIRQLNQRDKIAIIMVSHDIGNVMAEANKILHLQQKTLFYGSPGEYLKSEAGSMFLGGDRFEAVL